MSIFIFGYFNCWDMKLSLRNYCEDFRRFQHTWTVNDSAWTV